MSADKRSTKPAIIVAVAAVVMIAIVAVVAFAMKQAAAHPVVTTQVALDNAADKMFSGNNDAAITILKDQLKRAKNDDEKVNIYVALGAAYEEKGNKTEALDANKQAGAIRPGYGINQAIARTAEAAGDKATALDYYQRNRELIKSGKTPQAAGDLPTIEAAITRLGGKL